MTLFVAFSNNERLLTLLYRFMDLNLLEAIEKELEKLGKIIFQLEV